MNQISMKSSNSQNKLDRISFDQQSLEPESINNKYRQQKKVSQVLQVTKSVRTLTNNHIRPRQQYLRSPYYDETVKRLADYDFEYIFYRENQMKFLDLGIDAINKLHNDERSWLGQEVKKIGISFVVEKLATVLNNETGPGVDQYDLNKLTWAEMFVKQPGIQNIMGNFLAELKRVLDREMIENKQQLVNYIKFPRFSGLRAHSIQKNKQEIEGQVYSIGQEVAKTILTIKQERNKVMDRRRSYVDQLRGSDGNNDKSNDDLDSQSGKKTMHEFFEKLPPIIKKRNNALISKITEYVTREQSAKLKFESIINSHKLFGEQMQQMVILKNIYDQEEKRKQEVVKYTASMAKVNKTIETIESDNRQFDNDILQLEDHSNLERIRRKRPTAKLMKELENWAEELENVHMDSVQEYALKHEYWDTAESFEEILVRDTKGWELQRNAMTTFWVNRERKLKERYLFKIEAQEVAMQEIKLKCANDLNRMEMQLMDYESQQMNLNIYNKYDSIEQYIHEQQHFIKQLGIANIQDFKSPFQVQSDKKIKAYKAQEKKKRVLSRLGTTVMFMEDSGNDQVETIIKKSQPSKSVPAFRRQSGINNQIDQTEEQIQELSAPILQDLQQRPILAGTGSRYKGTITVDLDKLSILHSKVNTYFKVMMNLHHQMDRANHHLGFKENQILETEYAKNQMHRKCVKYQDLVHGLMRISKELLTETRIITTGEILQLNLLQQLDDLKLTMDTGKIDGLLNTLQNFHFDKKIENYRNIQNQIYEANVKLAQVFKELENSKWYLSDQNLILDEQNKQGNVSRLARSSTSIFPKTGSVSKEKSSNYSGEKKQIMIQLSKSQQTHQRIQELMDINYSDILNIQTNVLENENQINEENKVSLQKDLEIGKKKNSIKSQGSVQSQSHSPLGRARRETSLIKERHPRVSKKDTRSNTIKNQQMKKSPTNTTLRTNSQIQTPGLHPFVTRMTFFGETSDEVLKFTSKKKIFYLYDQINNTSLPTILIEQLEKELIQNPIVAKLLLKNKEGSEDSFVFSSSSSSSSLQNEEKISFEGMIKTINEELQKMYTINTLERCKENAPGKKKFIVEQLIQTVDVLKIEGYSCPQINMVPIKLLLLKKKTAHAKTLLMEGLQLISLLYPQNDFTKQHKTYLKGLNQVDQSIQTEGQATESDYQIFQKQFKFFIKQATDKLQKDANKDKIYIDEMTKQMQLWNDVEKSFSQSKDSQSFLKKLNENVMEQNSNAYDNGKFVTQLEFEQRVQELEETIAELAENHASQIDKKRSSTGPLSGKYSNVQPGRQSVFSAKSSKTLAYLKKVRTARASSSQQTLQDLKEMKVSDGNDIEEILIENYEKLGSIHDSSRYNKTPDNQIVLPRQEELLSKGMINVTKDILNQMDQKMGIQISINQHHHESNYQNIGMIKERNGNQQQYLHQMLQKKGKNVYPRQGSTLEIEVDENLNDNSKREIRTKNAFTQVPRELEIIKIFRENEQQSDVNMIDLQLILEFKQRSIDKIKRLEQLIKSQKSELFKVKNRLRLLMKEQSAHSQVHNSNQTIVDKGMRLLADINDDGNRPMVVNKMELAKRSKSSQKVPLQNEISREEDVNLRASTELLNQVQIQLINQSESSKGDTINIDGIIEHNNLIDIQLDDQKMFGFKNPYSTTMSGFNTIKSKDSKAVKVQEQIMVTYKDTKLEDQINHQNQVAKPSPQNRSQESIEFQTSNLFDIRESKGMKLRTPAENSRCSLKYNAIEEKDKPSVVVQKRPKSSVQGHTGLFGRKRYFEQPGKLKLENSLQKSLQYCSTKNSIIQQKRQNQILSTKKQSYSTLLVDRSAERTSDALTKSCNNLDQNLNKMRNTDFNFKTLTSNSVNTLSRNQLHRNFKTPNIDEGPIFCDDSFFYNRASKEQLQKKVLHEFEMYKSSLQVLAQKKSQPVFQFRNNIMQIQSIIEKSPKKTEQTAEDISLAKQKILFQSMPADDVKERPMTTSQNENYNFRTKLDQKNRLQTATYKSRKNQIQ